MKGSSSFAGGHVVLITGGTGGIGREIASRFLQCGEKVFIAGRKENLLENTVSELESASGGEVYTLKGDLSVVENCERIVKELVSKAGRIDILVNCAGIYYEKPIGEVNENDWDMMLDTNLKGTFFVTKYAMPYLAQSKGSVVNVGSTAGVVGFDALSAYCAAKGGLTLMTKALAAECAKYGVRVNIVSPDMVRTGMLDVGFERSGMNSREEYDNIQLSKYPQTIEEARFLEPGDVAKTVMFLAYRELSEPITGANIVMDFGMTSGRY